MWEVRRTVEGDIEGDVHVVPVDDLHEHEPSRVCWCVPHCTQEEGADVLVTHRSADGRELTTH
jgi:hypothetical protein